MPSADSTESGPPLLPTPPLSSSSAPGFAPRRAELVPEAPSRWQGSGLDLSAPKSRAFAQVLAADFDGDQKLDALAWLVPGAGDKNAPRGELWYYPNGSAPRMLTPLPGFVPSGPDCALTPLLTQTGMRSATLDVSAVCKSVMIARAPARALVVIAPSLDQPVLLTLRAAQAAPAESLDFTVDSSDQDQDGRDDVRLTISVAAQLANGEPAAADLTWLDRAAGASRSESEPGSSLLHFLGRLGARARMKHGSYRPETNGNVLRLLSSLCAESGVARLFDEDGAPFHCGDLTHVVDAVGSNDIASALTQGDVLEAFSVLRRDGWYFRAMSAAQRKLSERELLHAVTRLDVDAPYVAHAQPTLPQLPHYSPLWFEADGALLIRGPNAVTRVTADHTSEALVSDDAGVPSWPVELAAPSGQRITGTSHACDRSELLFNQSDAAHGLLAPLTTRLLAARPASCAGHGTGPSVVIAPLGFDESGLDALVSGSHVTTPGTPKPAGTLPALGSPSSPDGRWLITPTTLGLLLIGERKELWQTSALLEHADTSQFSDCVVANDARAAACIDAGHAILFTRGRPSANRK